MRGIAQFLTICAAVFFVSSSASDEQAVRTSKPHAQSADNKGQGPAVLWRSPTDIAARDLYYGPGGKNGEPRGIFTFQKEDLNGSSPKFDVVDQQGVRWRVKMGDEARPETAASRLVWAVGFFTNVNYFLPSLQVQDMCRLQRGSELIRPGGIVSNVRLKRYLDNEKKIGAWAWANDPFTDTREWNGLRVLMAVINNWDLKDENNAVYQVRSPQGLEQVYMVSDLGASFGTIGLSWTRRGSKSNLSAYSGSKLIRHLTPEYVDFYVPSRPALIRFPSPHELGLRLGLRWIALGVPRGDARWMGDLLAQLSAQQIRDAFRAARYSPEQVEGFSEVVEKRIAELRGL
jgi:hypothetical protein